MAARGYRSLRHFPAWSDFRYRGSGRFILRRGVDRMAEFRAARVSTIRRTCPASNVVGEGPWASVVSS